MRFQKSISSRAAFLLCFGLPLLCQAGPTAQIADTAAPIPIDGDISHFTGQPSIVLDQKANVVLGQNEWTGPDYASAKIYLTYDKDNLYIGADIVSKTPQFNSQNASNIYNGDALEVYVGTDLSNPQRNSYAPTDVQFVISPGKSGDGAEVYSMTDQADIPGAKVATKATAKGYVLEASIPLAYFFKINVGNGKSIGFDIALDDVGAVSKARAIQLSWGASDKSWQDPSVWGSLTFTGQVAFVNTAPKQALPGSVSAEMDPGAGKKGASTQGVLIWGFNDDLGGFTGSVTQSTDISSEGTGSMEVNADASQGWNQNLAVCSTVPLSDKWETFKSLTYDAYFPAGSLAKTGYTEIYITTQSPGNNWYEATKTKMHEGWNHVKEDVDPTQFKGGVTKVYFIFNSGGPIKGTINIDNVRGIAMGAAAAFTGKVVQKDTGAPIAGAMVAVSKKLVTTAADGTFKMNVPEDTYKAEVFAPGFKTLKETVTVSASQAAAWTAALEPEASASKPAVVDVFFNKKVRTINPHYIYGNNIAAWHEAKWFTDPTALKEIEGITSYFRIPGGEYGNIWRWKTGDTLQKDGKTVQTVWAFNWPAMVDFVKTVPNGEFLYIANMMTMDVQNCLDWLADAKARGLKVKYVELGNEPDYEADMMYNGQNQYWTVIDNYCQHFIEFSKAIKAKYPDIKIMGPCPAQVENHERKEGSPWLAGATSPWWVEKFLEECGPYVDVVSVHSYPYWSNDSDSNLFSKTDHWKVFIPQIRASIQKNIPDRANQIEIAVSEWNSGDENSTTARLVNGLFCADYLAQMMLWGVNQSNIWDLYTQKVGQGGGHGMLDPNNDPDRPFEPRAHYWALYMMEHHFGTTLYQAVTDSDDLSAYASTGNGKKYLLVINKNPKTAYQAAINLGAGKGKVKLDFWRLSSKEYQWSENLYRPVINSGPSHLRGSVPVKSRFEYDFPPYSITCVEMTPAP